MLVYITPEQFAPSSLYEALLTSENIARFLNFFFFWVTIWLCRLFLFLCVCYTKGREASDNMYTVYTAHPAPPSYQNVPENGQERRRPLPEAAVTRLGERKPLRSQINKKKMVLLIGMYNLCNSWNHIWYRHLLKFRNQFHLSFRLIEES